MKKLFTSAVVTGICLFLSVPVSLFAQEETTTEHDDPTSTADKKGMHLPKGKRPTQKVYLSSGMDGYILSTATSNMGDGGRLTTPRFTAFFHIGAHLNYDFSKNVGIFTGINIKNIGFIEKEGDLTTKRRTYTAGIPLGLKLGNVRNGHYLMLGGGVDFPFNYKEKAFVKRSDKDKFNEWFSERTPAVLPYAFVGFHLHPGMSVKFQYYPTNFLNEDFTQTVDGAVSKPYAGYKVNLMMLTLGIDISYYPKD